MARQRRQRARRALIVGVAMLLGFSGVALAAIPKPGKFAGATSQTNPDGSLGAVTMKMTHHGRRISSFDITWLAPCDGGFTTLSQGTHATGSVSSRGRFRGHGSYSSNKGNLEGTQYTATVTDTVSGRFLNRKKAKGTFQATAVLLDSSGRAVSTCTSPAITWSAEHG